MFTPFVFFTFSLTQYFFLHLLCVSCSFFFPQEKEALKAEEKAYHERFVKKMEHERKREEMEMAQKRNDAREARMQYRSHNSSSNPLDFITFIHSTLSFIHFLCHIGRRLWNGKRKKHNNVSCMPERFSLSLSLSLFSLFLLILNYFFFSFFFSCRNVFVSTMRNKWTKPW